MNTDFITNGDLNDPFRSFISKSRYARWIPEFNRRETWEETVNRYVDFISAKADLDPDDRAHLRYNIVSHKVMPSMRALMTAGEALERSNVAGYNPVTGDTKVLVRGKGMMPISKLIDSDEQVLNVDGRWADATFRSYGVQETYAVTAQKNKTQQQQVTRATSNHRWILSGGTVVPTSELKAGDRLAYASAARPDTDNIDYELGLIHGLVYGDGTSTYSQERLKGYHIRLCGSSKELLPLFEKHGSVCYPPSANGDPVVMLYGAFAKTHGLKSLPDSSETEEYLLGFIRGWLAADGSVSVGGQATLCADEAGYEWLVDNGGLVGILHTGFHELNPTTNFGDRKRRTLSIRLDRASMVAEDFIIDSKREKFEAHKVERYYTVKSVEKTGMEEEVFCAEVPDTNTFVLSSGLVTGNCSFIAINDLRCFDEALYILMCGTGLGFSAEKKHIRYLPEVPSDFVQTDEVIVVHDSKEGWASAYRELIATLWRGELPKWDLRQLRPEGARLKTFGGRSSGPEPLNELFEFTVRMVVGAKGRKLKPIEAHDLMCKIGSVVVVGGVRRSALISLSSLDDADIRDAKSGEWWNDSPHRALSNNSAVYNSKPSRKQFDEEWGALVASGSGERGIFNLAGAKTHVPERRDASKIMGTNPCAEILLRDKGFCVTPDTPLITKDGIYDIGTLRDQEVEVWNGNKWSTVTVRRTRKNTNVVRVQFGDGSYLDCTPDHKFSVKNRFTKEWSQVEAQNLMDSKYVMQVQPTVILSVGGETVPEAYTLGFAVGDGTVWNDRVYIDLYGEKDQNCPVEGSRFKKYIPKGYSVERQRVLTTLKPNQVREIRDGGFREIATWDKSSALRFFAGLADADGSVVSSGGIRIYLSGENNARDAQLVLTKFGIKSSVNLCQKAGTETNLGVRSRDLWYLQITDARDLPTSRLDASRGHESKFKGKFQTVRSVTELEGTSDVYCFNEPENHMAVFANVYTYQCNLTEVIVEPDDTLEDLKAKVSLATKIGTWQSTLTNFPYLRDEWRENAEEERLLGVSMTGQMGHATLNGSNGPLQQVRWLKELKKVAVTSNRKEARRLGINPAAAITTVKPSGTVSTLTNTSSGMHAWHDKFYIRTVRCDKNDPLATFLEDGGIPMEEDVMNPKAVVFSFPFKAPEGALVRDDMPALKQLETWLVYKTHWTEHSPSVTVSVRPEEWEEVGDWVFEHFDLITGVSFLPHSDHVYKQAPFQSISEKEYDKAVKNFPKSIDWTLLPVYETEDTTTGSQTLACTSGVCEIPDLVTS